MGKHVDRMVTVAEDTIARAILLFWSARSWLSEGAGAVPLAALLENTEEFRGKRVVLVVSGGNIDFTLIDRIILKGSSPAAGSAYSALLSTMLPAASTRLPAIIGARVRANILSVAHDRATGGRLRRQGKGHLHRGSARQGHLAEVFHSPAGQGVRGPD